MATTYGRGSIVRLKPGYPLPPDLALLAGLQMAITRVCTTEHGPTYHLQVYVDGQFRTLECVPPEAFTVRR
jgi:hypothetical protein